MTFDDALSTLLALVGRRIAVVLRDRDVTAPGSRTYRYDAC